MPCSLMRGCPCQVDHLMSFLLLFDRGYIPVKLCRNPTPATRRCAKLWLLQICIQDTRMAFMVHPSARLAQRDRLSNRYARHDNHCYFLFEAYTVVDWKWSTGLFLPGAQKRWCHAEPGPKTTRERIFRIRFSGPHHGIRHQAIHCPVCTVYL